MIKKRLLFIGVVLFFIIGCDSNKVNNSTKIDDIDTNNEEEIKEEVVENIKDDNPIKASLYLNKKKATEVVSPMTIYTDIVSLECYYTDDENLIDGNFKNVFDNYYNKYTNIDKYKIGYRVKFTTTDFEVDKYIYRPRDVESYFNYVQTYLYDDIHQDSGWYSHLEDSSYTDNSRLTSIKFTASTYIDRVNSNIEVTVFTYDDDDIDDGIYKGNNKYTVIIKKG